MKSTPTRPWKKNLRQIPNAIRVKLAKHSGPLIAATTKTITAENIQKGLYHHLSLRMSSDGVEYESPVIPPLDIGRYSALNVKGGEFTRKDLPKITKSFYVEAPNFGDWSNGSHTVVHSRLVYQKEYIEPRDISINIDLLKNEKSNYLLKFAVDFVLDQGDIQFEEDLIFCLNLLQENVGSADIFPTDTTKADFLKTVTLDWEIFPPGTVEEVIRHFSRKFRHAAKATDNILRDRVETFSKLKPIAYVQGQSGFNHYIGAQFADDLVVFENVRYGNALYVLYENWRLISKRSRLDLIKGTDAGFDRIVHGPLWKEQLQTTIRQRMNRKKSA